MSRRVVVAWAIWYLSSYVASGFILYFLVAMSRRTWSTLPEEEKDRDITFMDR